MEYLVENDINITETILRVEGEEGGTKWRKKRERERTKCIIKSKPVDVHIYNDV